MNVQTYLEMKKRLENGAPTTRSLCLACLQPDFGCYCRHLKPFDPKIKFVILMHPLERKRRIATGRMSHLSLEGSALVVGSEFNDDPQVNSVLADPSLYPVILYPGSQSLDLSAISPVEISTVFPEGKRLAIFVVDGTWATAGKMLNRSENLKKLPRVCFVPKAPSRFRVRKQPAEGCFSTIEAIHQTIELVSPACGFSLASRQHDALLYVFDKLVERQLEFIRQRRSSRHGLSFRRERSA